MHLGPIRLLLLSVLAFVPAQDPAPSTPQPAAQATPAATQMATCYLYRPRAYRGSAVRIGIFIDDVMAANLVNGRWVALHVPAGHHTIRPKDNQNGAEADFEAGKEYYFKSSWGEAGMFHGAHKLFVPVMKEQGAYEIKQLKQLDPDDISWPADRPSAPAKP